MTRSRTLITKNAPFFRQAHIMTDRANQPTAGRLRESPKRKVSRMPSVTHSGLVSLSRSPCLPTSTFVTRTHMRPPAFLMPLVGGQRTSRSKLRRGSLDFKTRSKYVLPATNHALHVTDMSYENLINLPFVIRFDTGSSGGRRASRCKDHHQTQVHSRWRCNDHTRKGSGSSGFRARRCP